MCLKELLSTLFVQLWKGNLIFFLSLLNKVFLCFFFALLNLCRCDVFKEEKFLYLEMNFPFFCYSIIFPFSAQKNCFHIFLLFSRIFFFAKIVIFSRRLTKRKNELNLIANRDATTQLLCQYAKNTQTFNSTGVAGSFGIWNFCSLGFNFQARPENALFCHTRKNITFSRVCPKIYFMRFSIIFFGCKFHATKKIPHSTF